MKEKKLLCWEEFEREIGGLFRGYEERCRKLPSLRYSPPLFRGQGKVCWSLKTTLERYAEHPFTMREYWKLIRGIKSHVESVTERRWELAEYPEGEPEPHAPPFGYEFMVYLRHHGFPSPLLDWSASPYVAAFFAFRSVPTQERPADLDGEGAIYCYQEYWEGAKIWDSNEPHIIGLGPTITTTSRHFRQQSWYTICRAFRDGHYAYANHEEVFHKGGPVPQDVLTKYRIPFSQWQQVRERLSMMNINAYTLFGNEEGLMEALAYKAIIAKSL